MKLTEPKMNPRKIAKAQARVRVLEKLINTFRYCRKLVRRYLAELLDKEAFLRQALRANQVYQVQSNGQLSLFDLLEVI